VKRSWLAFAVGLCLVLTPLRELWLLDRLGAFGPVLLCATLVGLAWWSTRGDARVGRP
jgi:hypothetical protein